MIPKAEKSRKGVSLVERTNEAYVKYAFVKYAATRGRSFRILRTFVMYAKYGRDFTTRNGSLNAQR